MAATTLRIERSLEESKQGTRFKEPKRASHKRTIQIDDPLIRVLLAEREKHLRIVAGIPDGVTVDLGLIKLPDNALMFPNLYDELDFTKPRRPKHTTQLFQRRAHKLFPGLRLHDLRGSHETALPVHVVAARCGHDPAVLLRSYAKRTKNADTSAAAIIGRISAAALD